ncbi:MAG: ankyrin repeat domain-containing protein [Granulosicoccaceae bacterium]
MSYHDINVAEVGELLQRDDLTIIDMRDAQSRDKGQLPNAQLPSDAVINSLIRQRRNNPPVLVYCYHGNSSRDLCSFLIQTGLNQVYNLVGGWAAWESWQQQKPDLNESHKNWLSEQGFDPNNLNSRVDMGMSPLMVAALKGEHELVDALLAAGADPKQVNDDEHHALWFACVNGDTALVQKLVACGSDINNRNINGVTCVIYAASTGKLDVLQALVAAGADLAIATHDGVSVLESASTLPVLRYLKSAVRQAS